MTRPLRQLLLSAALCVLRPASIGRQIAPGQHRCQRRQPRRGGADPRVKPGDHPDPPALATAAHSAARRFKDFTWQTRNGWSCERRVVAKAEWTGGEANPRFVVTSLTRERHAARHLYEKIYCARGEMENRIKECQRDRYADRTPAFAGTGSRPTPCAPTSRGCGFCRDGYVLICALRRISLTHTQFARAACGTNRLTLLKIGALVRTSVRRIKLAMPSACPYQAAYRAAHTALTATAAA
jgi:hypothetical protein